MVYNAIKSIYTLYIILFHYCLYERGKINYGFENKRIFKAEFRN